MPIKGNRDKLIGKEVERVSGLRLKYPSSFRKKLRLAS